MSYIVYDIETYPNVFTFCAKHYESGLSWVYEISSRRNDSKELVKFLRYLSQGYEMVGFNNIGFDYPVLHQLITMGQANAIDLYTKAAAIIESEDKFIHIVYPSDRYIDQIDLYKIHHFDNKARATSLKVLEFNMQMDNISDLPFPPGAELTHDQIDELLVYNMHDVDATCDFLNHSLDKIEFRRELTKKYSHDFMNHNDTKIGKDFFIMQLEQSGVACYDYSRRGRTPKQTVRPVLKLREAILPSIQFEESEFTRVLNWLRSQEIVETKGVFKDLTATINGFEFVFGTGGIHGSVESQIIESDDTYTIIDIDVASFYPNLAISNRFYPEHLGEKFCDIYKSLYDMRKKYKKGTAENAMLKLALNGTYGDSNNKFSVFYDPLFTMKITLNGQLLLCKLAEDLMCINDLALIQINTDGCTVKVPRDSVDDVMVVCREWEKKTGLTLEDVEYTKMCIRDVNSYIAVSTDGKIKRKGCYEYNLDWNKNASSLVVPKVAELVLLDDGDIGELVRTWDNKYDFMLRTKVPRSGKLALDDKQIQNVSRYYVAKGGQYLWKWLPPLKNKTNWRKFAISSGWGVQVCNDINDFGKLPIDYDFYINEVEKIVLGLS